MKLLLQREYWRSDGTIDFLLGSKDNLYQQRLYLYPKAKDKSVDYVIKNYTKYFKPINNTKFRVPY